MVAIQDSIRDFVHPNLNEEIRFLPGYYVLTEEERLPFQGREILYFLGHGVLDNSCCGYGSVYYALVPGFIVEWKYGENEEGRPVTRVEPIWDEALQKEIMNLLKEKEAVLQVNFC